jgi:MFS family permease
VHISIYSPLGGVLWPIVESYLSGGREGPGLRRALGWWNVAWSSAGFIGAVVVSPLLSEHAIAAIMIFGGVQAISLPFVAMYSRMPGAHHADAPRERPLVFKQLLVTFRILLPAAYVVMNTLMPYLPSAMKGIEVGGGWKTGLVAVYLLSRALTFLLLEVWTKWHGRWSLAVVGGSLLLGGFGVTVMAPTLGPGIGLAVMIAGLISFGMGMSAIYVGAIYYAMEVAHSEVDAGGAHEALIGVGYMGGPLCGLIAGLLFSGPNFEPALLGMAGLVGTGATLLVVARIPRKGKPQERLVRNNG